MASGSGSTPMIPARPSGTLHPTEISIPKAMHTEQQERKERLGLA